ncbi:cell wall-binding repeat-containing protein [Herbiconiux sp. CPCC 205716]|uniref:Cell wall-binding repeat-containing protein n=1 Tax=Herbiconiux gentiana TaxID=2970912 RepID=A0ABT2GH40_9MICO|nr:cell wall-binding repeat-containing protein [Herbiconiux gentiana]MCS5715543.1 cell wall-binding repeat-containing protein [Herbiconiux gentiana]
MITASVSIVVTGWSGAAAGSATAGTAPLARVELVSRAADNSSPADSPAFSAATSPDGRFVVFVSAASNIASVTSPYSQVYLKDRANGTTRVVSSVGGNSGNGHSSAPDVSDDGSIVSFRSFATNLTPTPTGTTAAQLLIWSRSSGDISLASTADGRTPTAANYDVGQAELAGDGRTVAFVTSATNLVSTPTNGNAQIYKRDLISATTQMVSITESPSPQGSPSNSFSPSISFDGRFIAFETAGELTAAPTAGLPQIYRRDTMVGDTDLVSVSRSGSSASNSISRSPSISADGRFVAFESAATDLTDLARPGSFQIYLRDLQANLNRLVSKDNSGTTAATGTSSKASISPDGRQVSYISDARDLVPQGSDLAFNRSQVYLFDRGRGTTIVVSSPREQAIGDDNSYETSTANGGVVVFSSQSTNLLPEATMPKGQVYVASTNFATLTRMDGADRFGTSATISKLTFASGVPVAYVVSGVTFPDALSGAAAAGREHGPVLLVTPDSIPTATAIELQRLKPQRIVVAGGTSAIHSDVEKALGAYSPLVSRISGADRFEVSAKVSETVFDVVASDGPTTAFVASGEVFPDALSAGAIAAGQSPVLLVGKDRLPTLVAAELRRLAPDTITVLGGPNAVSDGVVAALQAIAPVNRIGGQDRFDVSAGASAAFPVGTRTVFIASGVTFPDALSGSAAAIQRRAPVLLVTPTAIPDSIRSELRRLQPTHIVVLGGTSAISAGVFDQLTGFLAR